MTTKVEVELNNFFVFNSLYGNCEGEEHKKILFYFPNTDHLDVQIKNMGLAEAIIQFTASFKPNGPVNSVHSLKKRQIYYQAEENFWMVMTLNVPYLRKNKEGTETKEYMEDEIQDHVYENVLKQSYYMYRLFSGTFVEVIETKNLGVLKTKLEQFYTAYLISLKLQHCDIMHVFNGMQYLPLEKQIFLKVQCFINALECNFPMVKNVAFLYNDHLVWSGIEPDDMQVVYEYLISTLLPAQIGNELLGGSMPRNGLSPFSNLHHGRFITGPSNIKTSRTIGKVPKVHLYAQGEPKAYHLAVYRALSASVCLFLSGDVELTVDHFKELDGFIGPQLSLIVSEIAEYCSKQVPINSNAQEPCTKFIYFNKLNLAYKSTVHLDNKRTGNLSIPPECAKIMADINSQKDHLEHSGETIVKTMNDYSMMGKVSNLREVYVVLQQKNANLFSINDEVNKLLETELKGIFFHSM